MEQSRIGMINDWLIDQGLLGLEEGELLAGFCERCRIQGLHIVQAAIFLDTLHPVLESRGFYWDSNEDRGARQRDYSRYQSEDNAQRWRGSPFHFMLESGLSEMHIPLDHAGRARFTILDDLKSEGHTGYLALIHTLSGMDAIGEMDNLYSRWSTDRPGGFSAGDLDALRKLIPALALAIKSASLRQIAKSLVEVYLGRDPGQRVLEGRIARGKVESIQTVLWYSDMENYTSLSETVDSSELISLLNDYSEAVIAAVYGAGGDVLKLIGDGILAIFNQSDPYEAAQAALRAQHDLQTGISMLNSRRHAERQATTSVYLALHVGEVFYGNIGSDERLDFTVIGPAVNEVCRMAAMCRTTGQSLIISHDLARLLPEQDLSIFNDIGSFQLKGVKKPKQLYGIPRKEEGSPVSTK